MWLSKFYTIIYDSYKILALSDHDYPCEIIYRMLLVPMRRNNTVLMFTFVSHCTEAYMSYIYVTNRIPQVMHTKRYGGI